MRNKTAILLLLGIGLLALKGDGCILESRDVEVPFTDDVILTFTSTGFSDEGDTTIDFGATLAEIEADAESDIDSLVSASIKSVEWKLLVNRGSPGTMVSGTVAATRVGGATVDPAASFSNVAINSKPDFEPAPVELAAIDLLIAGFDEYIAAWNADQPIPNLVYRFPWSTTSSTDANFDWQVKITYTLVGKFSVEVPDLFDP